VLRARLIVDFASHCGLITYGARKVTCRPDISSSDPGSRTGLTVGVAPTLSTRQVCT
jgi:hypothetical protein